MSDVRRECDLGPWFDAHADAHAGAHAVIVPHVTSVGRRELLTAWTTFQSEPVTLWITLAFTDCIAGKFTLALTVGAPDANSVTFTKSDPDPVGVSFAFASYGREQEGASCAA